MAANSSKINKLKYQFHISASKISEKHAPGLIPYLTSHYTVSLTSFAIHERLPVLCEHNQKTNFFIFIYRTKQCAVQPYSVELTPGTFKNQTFILPNSHDSAGSLPVKSCKPKRLDPDISVHVLNKHQYLNMSSSSTNTTWITQHLK